MSQLFIPSSPDAKSPTQSSQHGDRNLRFSASTTQVGHMADILGAISSIHHQALIIVNDSGMTLYSEYNHILNAQLTIDAALFSVFELSSSSESPSINRELRLGIDVQLISDSFAAAASTTLPRSKGTGMSTSTETVVCYMKYDGDGCPLIIEFEDRLMSEQIEFCTFYIEMEYPYDTVLLQQIHNGHELLINRNILEFEVILKGDLLSNLLQDLLNLNTEELYMQVSNHRKGIMGSQKNELNFISKGSIGYLKLIFPNGKTMLEKLEIFAQGPDGPVPTTGSLLSCLNFLPLMKILKAVKMSSKCKIMRDTSGVLSVQLLCKRPTSSNYPGTLVAFNMLESSLGSNDVGQKVQVDVSGLFDDQLYKYIKDASPAEAELLTVQTNPIQEQKAAEELLVDSRQPFSYAAFKRLDINKDLVSNGQEGEHHQNRSRGNDRDTSADFSTVGGAVEIPLFL